MLTLSITYICTRAYTHNTHTNTHIHTHTQPPSPQLKQLCNDDHGKMQLMLPELLEANRLTNFVITAVYNPRYAVALGNPKKPSPCSPHRIQLGNLCPTKCKIMASKKVSKHYSTTRCVSMCVCHGCAHMCCMCVVCLLYVCCMSVVCVLCVVCVVYVCCMCVVCLLYGFCMCVVCVL